MLADPRLRARASVLGQPPPVLPGDNGSGHILPISWASKTAAPITPVAPAVTPTTPVAPAVTPTTPVAPAVTPTTPVAPTSNPSPTSTSTSPATIQGTYQQALQRLLSGPSAEQAGEGIWESPQVQAYRTTLDRGEARDRALLAERAAAGGFSGSGGFETGLLGLRQAYATDLGRYAGDVAGQREQGRRQELLSALALAQAMGDTQSEQALRRELAQMQQGQFADELAFNVADRQAYYNQRALEALLGAPL